MMDECKSNPHKPEQQQLLTIAFQRCFFFAVEMAGLIPERNS
jgi:hypothetical protein